MAYQRTVQFIKPVYSQQRHVAMNFRSQYLYGMVDAGKAADGGRVIERATGEHTFCAQGFTSGLINIWPEQSVAILQALRASNYAKAMQLIRQIEEFETIRAEELNGTNVTGVKTALQLIGNDCGPTRPPAAWPLSANQQLRLKALMEGWGIRAAA